MAKARAIRERVRAIEHVRTVAKTMEMVSTARFRRAFDRSTASRPYTDRLTDLVAHMLARRDEQPLDHPLLREASDLRRDVLLVLTSNRGLCGTLNAAVLRVAMVRYDQLRAGGYEVLLHVVGKRGMQHLRFRGVPVAQAHTELGDLPTYDQITGLADSLMDAFLGGEISGVEVAYMQFISSAEQRPVIAQHLPMSNLAEADEAADEAGEPVPYWLWPSGDEIVRELLPAVVRLRMYQSFLESSLSEQIVRIQCMRNATENAEDMLRQLTREYNRLRQTQITTELAEIMGGASGRKDTRRRRGDVRQVRRMIHRRQGKVEVDIRSATPLSKKEMAELRRTFRQILRAEPLLNVSIDPELVGGAVIRLGDDVCDASVASRIGGLLESIRKRTAASS